MKFSMQKIEELKSKGKIRGYTGDASNGKGWSKGKQFVERLICEVCGNLFYCAPCIKKRSENSGKFCSYKCRGKHLTELYNEKYKELREQKEIDKSIIQNLIQSKEIYYCQYCGNQCKSKRKYCDRKCFAKAATKDRTITKNCLTCAKEIKVSPSQHNAGFGKFCSSSCSSIHRVIINKGKQYGNSKGGRRSDIDNLYFRSRWEANYARFLNFIKETGEIIKWEYEPKTFWFDGIKRGCVSYTPDFRITYKSGLVRWTEVKGYFDQKSKTKLKRMKKYFPNEIIDLLDSTKYRALSKAMRNIIPNWEIDNKKKI